MENEITQRIYKQKKTKSGGVVDVVAGYFVAYPWNNCIHVGFSLCNPQDTFNKETGLNIARGRARMCYDRYLRIPQSIEVKFVEFLLRCLSRRSYDNMEMISEIMIYHESIGDYVLIDLEDFLVYKSPAEQQIPSERLR